jgi:ElaB/YqjD/DUF883 family membrane-anchored ribosome-binding protein
MFASTAKEDASKILDKFDHEIKDGLDGAAHQAGQKIRHLYNSASGEIHHATDAVTNEIRTNPIRSSAIALGAGVLLGMLIRR